MSGIKAAFNSHVGSSGKPYKLTRPCIMCSDLQGNFYVAANMPALSAELLAAAVAGRAFKPSFDRMKLRANIGALGLLYLSDYQHRPIGIKGL